MIVLVLVTRFGLGHACNLSWVVWCLCCVSIALCQCIRKSADEAMMREGNDPFFVRRQHNLGKNGTRCESDFLRRNDGASLLALVAKASREVMKERFPQPGLLGCVALFVQTVSPSRPTTQKKHMKITQYRHHKGLQKFQQGPRWKKKTGNLILQLGALLSRSLHTLWARTWHTMLMTGPGLVPPTDRH